LIFDRFDSELDDIRFNCFWIITRTDTYVITRLYIRS